MNRHRSFYLPRLLVAGWMMFAWLCASNHCALGLMVAAATPATQHHCCAGGVASDLAPNPKTTPDCCQHLQATVVSPLSLTTPVFVGTAPWWTESVVAGETFARRIPCAEAESPPAPPIRLSFAEAVLQRSLRSHAPPSQV